MKKKRISVLILFCMLVNLIYIQNDFVFANQYATSNLVYKNGDGTLENPYQISTVEELKEINNHIDKSFILVNDIDCAGIEWNPLCIESGFQGNLDGNGYSICNINVVADTEDEVVGLFGKIGTSGMVKNLSVKNISINAGTSSAGSIAGENQGTIKNCFVKCNIKGKEAETGCCDYWMPSIRYELGGIAGTSSGKITECVVISNNVSEESYDIYGACVGGITGTNTGEINKCYTNLTIKGIGAYNGISLAGGICGQNKGHINFCKVKSNEIRAYIYTGGSTSGGICGANLEDGEVKKCYFSGTIIATASYTNYGAHQGGIVGSNGDRWLGIGGNVCENIALIDEKSDGKKICSQNNKGTVTNNYLDLNGCEELLEEIEQNLKNVEWYVKQCYGNIEDVKNIKRNDISIRVLENTLRALPVEGANVQIESLGQKETDAYGNVKIENVIEDVVLKKCKISVTKEGYREYYFYKDIYHKEAELIWNNNNEYILLEKLEEDDEINPYVSTVMCQNSSGIVYNAMQRVGTYHIEETSQNVTIQVNAIWNEKTPLSYVLYQENGNSYTSTDGKFTLNIPNAFEANKKIYIKLIATDGTTVIEETLFKIKKRVQSSVQETDGGMKLDLIDTDSTGILGEDIAFLSGQEVKLELKNVEIKASVEQGRVRILIGPSEKFLEENEFSETITNEDWEKWKKLCENQPEDLEFLSKLGNMVKGMDMALMSEIAKADTKVYGYAEGVLNDSNEVVLVGGLKIQASIETGLQGQYTVGPIPIYAKASISVEGGAEGSIGYNWTNKQLDKEETKITFEVEPALKGEGGVGVMAVATVGLEGKGSLPIEANIGGDGEYKISVKAGLSLKAQLLCFEYVLELAEAEIQLLPEEEKITRSLMQSLSMRDFSLSASEHLSEESLWLGDTAIQPFSLETTETNLVERTLKTNINPDAQVQFIDTGTTKMILWTESDANREIINNSKLVYSIYNEQTDTWSTPIAVADDGTADYAPTVVTDGKKIYVAWQNISKTFTNDATLSEVAKASTIAMSVWSEETGFSKPITVSKANTMAVTPKIALNNEGNPYVAYIENTNKDLLLTSGTNNILYSVIKENNVVHNTFVENVGLVMALDTTYTNGYEVSYTLDTDNDLATLEDREIITNDKSEFSTKNEVMDSNAIYIKNGNKTLRFWYQNDSIHMSDEAGMETVIYEDETGTLTDDFYVVSGTEGQLAVIWTATDEESNNQIEGILYNPEDGSWTKSVQISDTDAHVYNPQGIFTEDGKLQFLYKKTGTQTDLCVLIVTPSVDLAVDGVYCDETTFAPGSVATFSVKITNNGTKKADTYTVNIDGTKSTFTQALEPSESTVVEAVYMVPADFDYRTLNITVEAENDTDITDNTCSYEVGYTEVVVNVNDSKYQFGQLVEVRVANESCIDTTAVLEVRKDSRDGELLKTIDLGTLTKGELTTSTYLWNEETENYSEDAEALYFNVVSEKAEKYTNNNYDFVATPTKESDVEESFVLGDLNEDGAVKINDMLTMLHGISGSQILNEKQQLAADIDKDSKVTVRDMLRVMHYISGASSTL